jgi:hypothetical protein
MRLNVMFMGLLAWTAAIGVPALYAAAICKAFAVSHNASYSYSLQDMMDSINKMPVLMWIYSIAMTMLGTGLVLIGFTRDRRAADMSEI